jgi:hypothetical protein
MSVGAAPTLRHSWTSSGSIRGHDICGRTGSTAENLPGPPATGLSRTCRWHTWPPAVSSSPTSSTACRCRRSTASRFASPHPVITARQRQMVMAAAARRTSGRGTLYDGILQRPRRAGGRRGGPRGTAASLGDRFLSRRDPAGRGAPGPRKLMHVFDVLSDPVRRHILELLGPGEMASGEVVEAIGAEFGSRRRRCHSTSRCCGRVALHGSGRRRKDDSIRSILRGFRRWMRGSLSSGVSGSRSWTRWRQRSRETNGCGVAH